MLVNDVIFEVINEYLRAAQKHAPMNSPHEGYAVIEEELDELWDEIEKADTAGVRTAAMKEETIQIAAMAIRFCVDLI